jgi:hypothetical protein
MANSRSMLLVLVSSAIDARSMRVMSRDYSRMVQPENWIKCCHGRISHVSTTTRQAMHRVMRILQASPDLRLHCMPLTVLVIGVSVITHRNVALIREQDICSTLRKVLALATSGQFVGIEVEKRPVKLNLGILSIRVTLSGSEILIKQVSMFKSRNSTREGLHSCR